MRKKHYKYASRAAYIAAFCTLIVGLVLGGDIAKCGGIAICLVSLGMMTSFRSV